MALHTHYLYTPHRGKREPTALLTLQVNTETRRRALIHQSIKIGEYLAVLPAPTSTMRELRERLKSNGKS